VSANSCFLCLPL